LQERQFEAESKSIWAESKLNRDREFEITFLLLKMFGGISYFYISRFGQEARKIHRKKPGTNVWLLLLLLH